MGELEVDKPVKYMLSGEKREDYFESLVVEHLRMNGAYWGLTTLDLLHKLGAVNPDKVVSRAMELYHQDCGRFGANIGHYPHLLYTLSVVQVLAVLDILDVLDIEKVSDCLLLLVITHIPQPSLWLADYCSRWNHLISISSLRHVIIIIMPDRENERISDVPDNAVDVFHTYFGVAGLSLMEYPGLKSIEPAYALPLDVVNRIFFGK